MRRRFHETNSTDTPDSSCGFPPRTQREHTRCLDALEPRLSSVLLHALRAVSSTGGGLSRLPPNKTTRWNHQTTPHACLRLEPPTMRSEPAPWPERSI